MITKNNELLFCYFFILVLLFCFENITIFVYEKKLIVSYYFYI